MTSPQPKSVFALALETKYHLDDDSIKELAHLYMTTEKVSGRAGEIYLRTLINRTREALACVPEPLTALDRAEAPMYEQVKRGTLTTDIQYNPLVDNAEARAVKAKEHNRRCNWARSIKSELKAMLKAGVSLDDIDADTITKSDLREARKAKVEELVSEGTIAPPSPLTLAMMMVAKLDELINDALASGEDLSALRSELTRLAGK